MAIRAQRWFEQVSFATDVAKSEERLPIGLQWEVEFYGSGIAFYLTGNGEPDGPRWFADHELPILGILVSNGNDRRMFSEVGGQGMIFREGVSAGEEQWSVRWWFDASAGAFGNWIFAADLQGSIEDVAAGSTSSNKDDTTSRVIIVTVLGVGEVWTPP